MSRQPQQPVEAQEQVGGTGCLVRLLWLLIGNVLLVAAGLAISDNQEFPSLADAVFWLVVAGMIAIRYIDVVRLHGETVTGQPATLAHWRRYSVMLAAVALAGWLIAHLVSRGPAV